MYPYLEFSLASLYFASMYEGRTSPTKGSHVRVRVRSLQRMDEHPCKWRFGPEKVRDREQPVGAAGDAREPGEDPNTYRLGIVGVKIPRRLSG